MKVSNKFNKEWDFYIANTWLDFLQNNIITPKYNVNGLSAKECFYIYDSQGKLDACKEIELFKQILNRKANLNLQIKMWVEGFADVMEPVDDYMKSFKGDIPQWIKKAFCEQLKKKYVVTNPETWFIYDLKECG